MMLPLVSRDQDAKRGATEDATFAVGMATSNYAKNTSSIREFNIAEDAPTSPKESHSRYVSRATKFEGPAHAVLSTSSENASSSESCRTRCRSRRAKLRGSARFVLAYLALQTFTIGAPLYGFLSAIGKLDLPPRAENADVPTYAATVFLTMLRTSQLAAFPVSYLIDLVGARLGTMFASTLFVLGAVFLGIAVRLAASEWQADPDPGQRPFFLLGSACFGLSACFQIVSVMMTLRTVFKHVMSEFSITLLNGCYDSSAIMFTIVGVCSTAAGRTGFFAILADTGVDHAADSTSGNKTSDDHGGAPAGVAEQHHQPPLGAVISATTRGPERHLVLSGDEQGFYAAESFGVGLWVYALFGVAHLLFTAWLYPSEMSSTQQGGSLKTRLHAAGDHAMDLATPLLVEDSTMSGSYERQLPLRRAPREEERDEVNVKMVGHDGEPGQEQRRPVMIAASGGSLISAESRRSSSSSSASTRTGHGEFVDNMSGSLSGCSARTNSDEPGSCCSSTFSTPGPARAISKIAPDKVAAASTFGHDFMNMAQDDEDNDMIISKNEGVSTSLSAPQPDPEDPSLLLTTRTINAVVRQKEQLPEEEQDYLPLESGHPMRSWVSLPGKKDVSRSFVEVMVDRDYVLSILWFAVQFQNFTNYLTQMPDILSPPVLNLSGWFYPCSVFTAFLLGTLFNYLHNPSYVVCITTCLGVLFQLLVYTLCCSATTSRSTPPAIAEAATRTSAPTSASEASLRETPDDSPNYGVAPGTADLHGFSVLLLLPFFRSGLFTTMWIFWPSLWKDSTHIGAMYGFASLFAFAFSSFLIAFVLMSRHTIAEDGTKTYSPEKAASMNWQWFRIYASVSIFYSIYAVVTHRYREQARKRS
ncbi:unnamed protein product [Amoebophrya sp. A120]|nr:unnamed protein product [Amoebophrya sp. A120]|eukprot:GSA120T00021591001.1